MNRTSIELAARLYGEIDKIDDYLSRLSHSSANPQTKRRLTLHIEIEDPIGNPSLVEHGRFTLDESRRFCAIIEQAERERLTHRRERILAQLEEIGAQKPAPHPFQYKTTEPAR